MMNAIVRIASVLREVRPAVLAVALLCLLAAGILQSAAVSEGWMSEVSERLQAPVQRVQHTLERLETLGQLLRWAVRSEQGSIRNRSARHRTEPEVVGAPPSDLQYCSVGSNRGTAPASIGGAGVC
jgi:hypothetical protein